MEIRFLWKDAAITLEDSLILGDIHIGLEDSLKKSGYRLWGVSRQVIANILELVSREHPNRVVFLGDMKDSIGNPTQNELDLLGMLFDNLGPEPVVVLGNHDGGLRDWLTDRSIEWYPSSGFDYNGYHLFHGNALPSERGRLIACHWHPVIRIKDKSGGVYTERVWVFVDTDYGKLIMMPAFNPFLGGVEISEIRDKWIHMDTAEVYLSDGTLINYPV